MATLPLQTWNAPAAHVLPAPGKPAPALFAWPASQMVEAVTPATLSDLEWSIVDMAQKDSLASIREPGRLRSALYAFFALKPANRLANEKLETLRRVAVLAWRYRWNIAAEELQKLFAAGYSHDQYELIQHRIAAARSQRGGSKRV